MKTGDLTRRGLLTGGCASLVASSAFAGPSIGQLAHSKGIILGSAVEPDYLDQDPAYGRLISECCGSITAENALKWNAVAPERGTSAFASAERLSAFAKVNRLQFYGHCLVWHEAVPAWINSFQTAKALEPILADHISSVVGHFKGRISAWDVVNEPIERNDKRNDGLRKSIWLKGLGPDYIDHAFTLAHQADPNATLVLSDYGLEYDDENWMLEKRETTLKYLQGLIARRVPIHALGIQGHLIGNRKPAYGVRFREFLRDVAELGLKIFITELDVDDQKVFGSVATRDAVVAAHYRAFLDCALDETAVKRVTMWGLSDRFSSKRDLMPRLDGQGVRPLPFDAKLVMKPAGAALVEALETAKVRHA
jgi:endo-1,4-beta-xylanase